MTGPNRERAIELLLAAPARRPGPAAAGPCVDAETMAAWFDGGMAGEAAEQFEAHVAACASCQELLATMVRMVPAGAPAIQAVPRRPWTAWALPLAAAAALILVVWTTWPGGASRSPSSPVLEEEARMARAEAPAPAASPESSTAPAPGSPAGTAAPREAPAPPAGNSTTPQPSAAEPAPFSAAPADRIERESAPPAASPARQSAEADGRVEEKSAVAAPAAPAAAAETAAPRADAQAGTGDARARRIGDPSALARVARGARDAVQVTVQSPGGVWRWRADRALEFSSDSGSTWRPSGGATAAQVADILAGASPEAQTAWFVGRRGLVLVSIDGARFEVRTPPAPEDLIGVQATDGRGAIVRSVAGQAWRTADGGRTWAAVAP